MKKIFYLLATLAILIQTSCGGEGPTQSQVETSLLDAEAATAAFIETEWMIAVPPYGGIACFAISCAAGAVGSGFGSRQSGQREVEQLNADLPRNFVLPNNSFEEIGIVHNKLLNLFVRENGVVDFSEKLLNYDSAALTKSLLQSPRTELQSLKVRNDVIAILRRNNLSERIAVASNLSRSVTTNDQLIELLPIARKEKLELKLVASEYTQLKRSNKTAAEIATYLNGKCTALLSKEILTRDESAELVFITVLKHSNYYWSN